MAQSVLTSSGTIKGQGVGVTASTVAGLGSGVDGKVGQIRAGTTPYDFIGLVYDATYAKWVSPAVSFANGGTSTNSISPSTWTSLGQPSGFLPYSAFVTAGLTMQVRISLWITSNGAASLQAGYQINTLATNGTANTGLSTDTGLITGFTSATSTMKLSDWATVQTVTSDTWCNLQPRIFSNTNNIGVFNTFNLMYRWVA